MGQERAAEVANRLLTRSASPDAANARLHEAIVERGTGIEPASPAWKAGALPLSYPRSILDALESACLLTPGT